MEKYNQNLWRTIIVDHYSQPKNMQKIIDEKKYTVIKQFSDACVDNFYIGMILKDNLISKVVFNGVGCAISTSAIDIMIEAIKNKDVNLAKQIINNFIAMVKHTSKYDQQLLGKLVVFSHVYKQPNRIKCALIGINGIYKLLDSNNKSRKVS